MHNRFETLIGVWSPWLQSPAIEQGERRRFLQASLDESSAGCQDAETRDTLPQIFPVHALRRGDGTPDPFDALLADPSWDGADVGWESVGLPALELNQPRLVNAGSRLRFYKRAWCGGTVRQRSAYHAIDEIESRTGELMTRVTTRTEYVDQDGDLLMTMDNTVICRALDEQ